MAIAKRNKAIALPLKVKEIVAKAFFYQQLKHHCDAMEHQLKEQIEKSKDIVIVQGEPFRTEYGSISYTERRNRKVDIDKIYKLVTSGKLSLMTVLKACEINLTKLEKSLDEKTFLSVVKEGPTTEFLTIRAKSEVKAALADAFVKGIDKGLNPAKLVAKGIEE